MLQKALDFLRENREVAFATCEGNLPKIRMFQIMKQDCTRLYFATSAKKDVWRQLHANPDIELLAAAHQVSVRCVGTADFKVADDIRRWIYDNNEVLQRLYSSYDQMEYFSMNIAELDYYDLRPTPPIVKHFDLVTGDMGDGFVGERFAHAPTGTQPS